MNRPITKVVVMGSGIMGSGIACHFANIGAKVLLLDLPNTIGAEPAITGSGAIKEHRNKIVNDNLLRAIKSKPSPLYLKSYRSRITTGNLEDDLPLVAEYDWIIEVILEKIQPKKELYEKIEKYRKPGTLITSNTSGISINLLSEGRSDDFRKHFCGTHFFNPPRYLRLLEVIPNEETLPEITDFLMDYGQRFLGKNTVLAKDTPAFIANRIGAFSMLKTFNLTQQYGLSFETVDKLTGPLIARAKSATFRTADVVGLDTLVHVLRDLKNVCKEDEFLQKEPIPDYVQTMFNNKWLGSKTKQGFYRKEKDEQDKTKILSLDISDMQYKPSHKVRLPELELLSGIDDPLERIKNLFAVSGKIGDFFRAMWLSVFAYSAAKIPEITDRLFQIDEAIKSGFGWQLGIFETWQALGISKVTAMMKEAGLHCPEWLEEIAQQELPAFYRSDKGNRLYYAPESKSFKQVSHDPKAISFAALKEQHRLWQNKGASIVDMGDGIICLEFHTKMNVLGSEIFQGLSKAVQMAEESYRGLVIYNEGEHFSAGANIGLIYMLARDQEMDELNLIVKQFQEIIMRLRYSSIPVIAAIHGYTFGGGCELTMHADKVIAHAETYMGLVELGVGLIPAGGGTKEFALRLSDSLQEGDVRNNAFRDKLLTIAQAKVSTSAYEAFELGYLRKGIDEVIINRASQLSHAKKIALQMWENGYTQPIRRNDIHVLGKEGLGLVFSGADGMRQGNYISEYDQYLAEKLGSVLSGGNVSEMIKVTEDYLLNLERKTFVQLCMQHKSLERMHSFISKGKMLRN